MGFEKLRKVSAQIPGSLQHKDCISLGDGVLRWNYPSPPDTIGNGTSLTLRWLKDFENNHKQVLGRSSWYFALELSPSSSMYVDTVYETMSTRHYLPGTINALGFKTTHSIVEQKPCHGKVLKSSETPLKSFPNRKDGIEDILM